MGFATLDWIVLAGYFLLLGLIAWWAIRGREKSAADYFLAGRHVGWFVVGAAIFASNIGSEHVVGLAGTASEHGMALAYYEMHSWIVLLLGWVFIPFYLRTGVFTMPEFLERRYNPAARWILSVVSLLAYVLTKVSVTVYAGAVVFQTLMGIDFWSGALVTVLLTGLYTVLGGLRAVVYTETLQAFVLLLGSITISVIGLNQVGGFAGIYEWADAGHMNMWRPANDPDFPWPGIIFAGTIVGIWYWCTDQYIVQRTLAAANVTEARRGTIFAGLLKLAPVFIFMVPGVIAHVMVRQGSLDVGPSDQTFPALVQTLLPVGLRGLVAGGLMAALMSSLAAIFNSCSTLFTMDIYRKLQPEASQRTLVFTGRVATGVIVVLGIAWIPVMSRLSGQLYEYLQQVQAYIGPPIFCAFVFGIGWKRINGKGAVSGMVLGIVLAVVRILVEVTGTGVGGVAGRFLTMNFSYYALVMTAAISVVMLGVSLATAAPAPKQVEGLTFGTLSDADRAANRASWTWSDVVFTALIVAAIAGMMIWLRG